MTIVGVAPSDAQNVAERLVSVRAGVRGPATFTGVAASDAQNYRRWETGDS